MEEENKKLLIILIICVIISVISLIGVIPGNEYESQNNKNTKTTNLQAEKARKKSFADDALFYAKQAENAYVDRKEISNVAFTITDLKNNYSSYRNDTFYGCIIIYADINGNIKSKKIYITNKTYMITGLYSDEIANRLDQDVYKYSTSKNAWKESYNDCSFVEDEGTIKISTKTTEG